MKESASLTRMMQICRRFYTSSASPIGHLKTQKFPSPKRLSQNYPRKHHPHVGFHQVLPQDSSGYVRWTPAPTSSIHPIFLTLCPLDTGTLLQIADTVTGERAIPLSVTFPRILAVSVSIFSSSPPMYGTQLSHLGKEWGINGAFKGEISSP